MVVRVAMVVRELARTTVALEVLEVLEVPEVFAHLEDSLEIFYQHWVRFRDSLRQRYTLPSQEVRVATEESEVPEVHLGPVSHQVLQLPLRVLAAPEVQDLRRMVVDW
jgi:hypothetical protein